MDNTIDKINQNSYIHKYCHKLFQNLEFENGEQLG